MELIKGMFLGAVMENYKKRKKIVVSVIIFCCVLAVMLLMYFVARKKAIGDFLTEKSVTTLDGEVLGARNYGEGQISVNESGIFYINSEDQLSYYDYDTEERYVLCSTSQCRHNTEECNAYMGDKERYGGYALYNNSIYVLYKDKDSEYLELVSMDTTGQNKKTVSRIYAGNNTLNEWRLGLIGDVYYYNGYAYIKLEYDKKVEDSVEEMSETIQGEQLLSVRLSDGKIIELTEILTHGQDVTGVEWSMFSDNQAVYAIRYFDEKIPTEEEYYREYPSGNYDEFYISFWKNVSKTLEYQVFDAETENIKTLYSGKIKNQDHGTAGYSEQDPFYLEGAYEKQWLAMDYTDEKTMYYWLDPNTGEMEEFYQTQDAEGTYFLGWFYGEARNMIYDGKKILGREALEDEREQIFYIDLSTGERHNVVINDINAFGNVNALLIEETSRYIIGRGNGEDIYYIVTKDDFEKSYFREAKRVTF